jgi:hypothetical protein
MANILKSRNTSKHDLTLDIIYGFAEMHIMQLQYFPIDIHLLLRLLKK